MKQPSVLRCDRCGARVNVIQETAYEFRYACPCGHRGLVSWAHADPPPVFEAARQADLFRGTR